MKDSIPVYSHLYADYGCIASLMLTFECFETTHQLDAIPAHAKYYQCNEHGIAIYDEDFRLMKAAKMETYFLHSYDTGKKMQRWFLIHAYNSNTLSKIQESRMTTIVTENSTALTREAVLQH